MTAILSGSAVVGRDAPSTSWWGQTLALTGRSVRTMMRQGEFIIAVSAPVMLAICFYVPLKDILGGLPGVNYAQFLMPIITLQSVGFVATSAAMRAAGDGVHGINDRLRSMPVASVVPSLARALANSALLVVSLFWAVLSGLVIGWRPQHGVGYFLGYLAVAFAIGLILAIAGDAVGVITNDPVACSQAMALPQLILGMLSTGFVPISQFPEWITPFVRNQPISQFAELMRSLDTGTVDTGALLAPCLWAGGIAVFALAAAGWALGRGRTR